MEVMAEANEQPALLNQDVDDGKKPRRTKTAARPRRTTASRTGARRTKKQTKDDESIDSSTNNHSTLVESRDAASAEKIEDAPQLTLAQPSGLEEPAQQSNDQKSPAMSEPIEEAVSPGRVPGKSGRWRMASSGCPDGLRMAAGKRRASLLSTSPNSMP